MMLYVRFPLSLRNVEDLLYVRVIEVSHETARYWWNRFGPLFAAEIRGKRVSRMKSYSNWQWRLDEGFVKVKAEPVHQLLYCLIHHYFFNYFNIIRVIQFPEGAPFAFHFDAAHRDALFKKPKLFQPF